MNLEAFSELAGGLDHPEGTAWGTDGHVYAGGEAGQIYQVSLDGAVRELAREAVTIAETTDVINMHGDALVDLAEVLSILGGGAPRPRRRSRGRCCCTERKGNLVSSAHARNELTKIEGAGS